MTYEYASYFKLLLLCGYSQELQQYIDKALEEQDPLSDVILALCTPDSDEKARLSVLNTFLLKARESEIDYDLAVFDLVMTFLRKQYAEGTMSIKEMCHLMYRLALSTDRYFDEPWHTMYYMEDLYDEAEMGYYISKEDFSRKFHAFLSDGICLSAYLSTPPKESFLSRLFPKFRRNHV